MASRLSLQNQLEALLGSRNVYFQPPESVKMSYPAIRYEVDDYKNVHADDGVYLSYKRYSVTVIDKNPDSDIPDKVIHMPTCQFNRFYTSENLNHWNFSLYF